MIKQILLLLIIWLYSMESIAQHEPLPSSVYEWEMIPVEKTAEGKKRRFLSWPTKTLIHFDISATTLSSSTATRESGAEPPTEGLILVKNGKLGIRINGEKQEMGPRSIALIPVNATFDLYNAGDTDVTYFSIKWISRESSHQGFLKNKVDLVTFEYEEMDFKENPKGGRRSVMQESTATLEELEMHITTLNEGEKSHDPHVHPDEEIIVVLQGEVEEMINGIPYPLGTGSVIFLSSMDPHGIRNIGKGKCEYYAIRWTTKPKQSIE